MYGTALYRLVAVGIIPRPFRPSWAGTGVEMAAKKSAAKPVKSKKSAVARPAAKKSVIVKKPLARAVAVTPKPKAVAKVATVKAAPVVRAVPAAKPVAKPSAPVRKATATALVRATGDEAEAGDNLLAGPRNVQPYVPKRGEQYMNNVQLAHFREILQEWKQDLMLEVDRTVSHMKDEAANFPDPNDRATQEEEFSLELRTRDRERKLIRKIDEALSRIEDGSYGYCLETGEQIGIKRLEARPVATLSIEAQERRERREKQYGDRDDRYR
jgi:DnaK suppressor protein